MQTVLVFTAVIYSDLTPLSHHYVMDEHQAIQGRAQHSEAKQSTTITQVCFVYDITVTSQRPETSDKGFDSFGRALGVCVLQIDGYIHGEQLMMEKSCSNKHHQEQWPTQKSSSRLTT